MTFTEAIKYILDGGKARPIGWSGGWYAMTSDSDFGHLRWFEIKGTDLPLLSKQMINGRWEKVLP